MKHTFVDLEKALMVFVSYRLATLDSGKIPFSKWLADEMQKVKDQESENKTTTDPGGISG